RPRSRLCRRNLSGRSALDRDHLAARLRARDLERRPRMRRTVLQRQCRSDGFGLCRCLSRQCFDLPHRCSGRERCQRPGDSLARSWTGRRADAKIRDSRRHAAQARSLPQRAAQRREPRAHSARGRGGSSSRVLLHQNRLWDRGAGGVNLDQIQKLESKLLLSTYDRYPVLLHKGRGVYVFDNKGRKYLDMLSGIGVNALGYAHPALTKTIARQAKLLVHTSNLFYHEYQGRLAAALTKISGMDRAFFTNSGTEAWEGALKLARAYARANCAQGAEPKWRILALEHAFHGRTFGALATTHKEKYRAPFAPVVPGVEFVQFNDVADLERKFDSTVCAIGFEFVQGEGGIRPVSR